MRRLLSLTLVFGLCVALSACTGKENPPSPTESSSQQSTESMESSQPESTTVSVPNENEPTGEANPELNQDAKLAVSNNGGYYVKIDNKVYFREYGAKALENPAIFGQYLLNPTGNQSVMKYYDTETKETKEAFLDFGYGKIVYMNDIFFMNGLDFSQTEYPMPYVYAVNAEGKDYGLPEKIYGTIQEVLEDNSMFFVLNERWYNNEIGDFEASISGINAKGEKVFTVESNMGLEYIGAYGNHVVYAETDYANRSATVWYKVFSENARDTDPVKITTITCDDYQSFDFGELLAAPLTKEEYVPVAFRAGTGNMFEGGQVISFVPGREGFDAIKALSAEEYNEMPYVTLDENGICYSTDEPNTYFVKQFAFDDNGTLCFRDNSGKETEIVKDFIPGADYYKERKVLFLAETVDGQGYCMVANRIFDEEGSIGWRDAFRLLDMEYIHINADGTYDVISRVKYND